MTPVDAVTAAIEHGIPTARLVLFAQLAAAHAPRAQLVTVLSSYRPP